MRTRLITRFRSVVAGFISIGIFLPIVAQAAFTPPARLTFTFDDGAKRIYTNVRPIFAQHGLPAVLYGETGPLNSGEDWVMTWDEVRSLRDQYGWEIGSHTVTHPNLTTVSDAQLEQELAKSKQDFLDQGITTLTFATPLGAYNTKVLKAIARHYTSHRAAWGGPNQWPDIHNDYELITLEAKHNIPPSTVKQWIDEAITNRQWLVLLLHDVVDGVPQEYEYNKNDLKQIVDYAASRPIQVTTMAGALQLAGGSNIVQNSSFEDVASGFASGWMRSNTNGVTVDTNRNGNAPSPKNSLRLSGSSAENGALSGLYPVQNTEYLIKFFLDASALSGGGVALWVNEYNSAGDWISGQWLGGNYEPFFGARYFPYTPTSTAVASTQLYLYLEAGSMGTIFIDSVDMRAILGGGAASSRSSVAASSVPSSRSSISSSRSSVSSSRSSVSSSRSSTASSTASAGTNLIQNGSFEQASGGFAANWTRTNSTNVVRDTNNNGSAPQPKSSLRIKGTSALNAAISALVSIADPAAQYVLSFSQRITNYQDGGTSVWVNEYNANGDWISGQWLGGRYAAVNEISSFPYKPTSTNVRSIELELYAEQDSSLTVYIDGVSLRKK